jgi:hypothetical protein
MLCVCLHVILLCLCCAVIIFCHWAINNNTLTWEMLVTILLLLATSSHSPSSSPPPPCRPATKYSVFSLSHIQHSRSVCHYWLIQKYIVIIMLCLNRSRHRSAAAELLEWQVRVSPVAWMLVSGYVVCCAYLMGTAAAVSFTVLLF